MRFFYGEKDGKQTTTAVIESTSDYAQSIVVRKLGLSKTLYEISALNSMFGVDTTIEKVLCLNDLLMNSSYRATVKCDPRDEYNAEVGTKEAKRKADEHMKRAARKAIKRWQTKMIHKIMEINPETFEEALQQVKKKNTKNKTVT